ncbi:MAG: TonB-dependent receptor [Bacteroidia bacterium]
MQKLISNTFNILLLAAIFSCQPLMAQTGSLSGTVISDGKPVEFANVVLKGSNIGVPTDASGVFLIEDIPVGKHQLLISAIGYITIIQEIAISENVRLDKEFAIDADILNLSQIVITGSRNTIEKHNSPVIVNAVGARTLELTQSINIADGLNYSPGLRVENNCQNCGFTQLRMNGLDGPYSQVLINSRPIFSALAGVYGLEMLPANMVDRIEVVRGGGSVMYGGNGIAGTVNIITKDPFENSFEVGINQSLIAGFASDRTVNFNGSIVSEDIKKGITFFGFNRSRDHWDANGDGFSEIVALKNNTFGFDAFYELSDNSKIKLGAYYINEFRRGGNKFELFPHQADVAERLEHDIVSFNLSYDYLSDNQKHKLSAYSSIQNVDRNSYYGAGGRVLLPGDSLTEDDILALNAYGKSSDISTVNGFQYQMYISPTLTLTAGSEYIFNDVIDELPGYNRTIDQRVATWGTFAELEVKPTSRLTLLLGGRFDNLRIDGKYNLEQEIFTNNKKLNVFIPRFSAMYSLKENLKLRASIAQGYRGPQAFDEDLHLETVGGAVRFVKIDPDLEVETSNSANISLNYEKYIGKKQMNFVVEGFYTQLLNPFIFAGQEELPNGVSVITKRNGSGATVSGINIEANVAYSSKLIIQTGATLQRALYNEQEEIWAPEEPNENLEATTTNKILRTPNTYGYFSVVYSPTTPFTIAYSGVFTGSMNVAHVIDPTTEQTIIKSTDAFLENNIKLSYSFNKESHNKAQIFGGVQNIFNSYQSDFDFGANRDAGYVYGPMSPRTYFIGFKFGID